MPSSLDLEINWFRGFLCWSKLDILYIQLPFLIPYGPKRIVIKAQLSCGALDLNLHLKYALIINQIWYLKRTIKDLIF